MTTVDTFPSLLSQLRSILPHATANPIAYQGQKNGFLYASCGLDEHPEQKARQDFILAVQLCEYKTRLFTINDLPVGPGRGADCNTTTRHTASAHIFVTHKIDAASVDDLLNAAEHTEDERPGFRKIWTTWASDRQYSVQHKDLDVILVSVYLIIQQTGGIDVWQRSTAEHRREVYLYFSLQLPLFICKEVFSAWTAVCFRQIWAMSDQIPGVSYWRAFCAETILQLCEDAYLAKFSSLNDATKPDREQNWKDMTIIEDRCSNALKSFGVHDGVIGFRDVPTQEPQSAKGEATWKTENTKVSKFSYESDCEPLPAHMCLATLHEWTISAKAFVQQRREAKESLRSLEHDFEEAESNAEWTDAIFTEDMRNNPRFGKPHQPKKFDPSQFIASGGSGRGNSQHMPLGHCMRYKYWERAGSTDWLVERKRDMEKPRS